MSAPKTLTIGAIQMESRNGDVQGNLERALPLVEQAASRGAELICLPEFLPSGYLFEEGCWDAAEPSHGSTVQWLACHAARLNVVIGTSFLETDGETFRNVFVLMGPDGEYGRVYKQDVALFENFFMESRAGSHVLATPLGNIGVGICYENLRAFLSRQLVELDTDLLLQPHSCPTLQNYLPRWAHRMFNQVIDGTAQRYAQGLGIPAVFVNKIGPFITGTPMFPYSRYRAKFPGFTAIADSDGRVLEHAKREEAVLVATVTLAPERKTHTPLKADGLWAAPLPWLARKYMEFVDWYGIRAYRANPRKAAAAKR